MNEMDDKKMEQVAGGRTSEFAELWAEYQKKNCGGCTNASGTHCQTGQLLLMNAINAAKSKGTAVEAPPCYHNKNRK